MEFEEYTIRFKGKKVFVLFLIIPFECSLTTSSFWSSNILVLKHKSSKLQELALRVYCESLFGIPILEQEPNPSSETSS